MKEKLEMRFPLMTAHSGCMNSPKNTLLSVQTGLGYGADVIEEDVRVTRDGIVVLMHDAHINFPGHGVCQIAELNYNELKELEIASKMSSDIQKERVTRLDEILPLIKKYNRMVNLDIKVDDCIEPTVKSIKQEDMLDQVILSGCKRERADYIHHNHPELNLLLNADDAEGFQNDYELAVKKTCEDARALSCSGININYHFCRSELVQYASSHGLPVLVWTVNRPSDMKKFVEMGVYSITTQNIAALIDLKNEMSL